LSALAEAAGVLADLCDREAPEFGPMWRTISNNALALSAARLCSPTSSRSRRRSHRGQGVRGAL